MKLYGKFLTEKKKAREILNSKYYHRFIRVFLRLANTAGCLGGPVSKVPWKNFGNFHVNWLKNCFVCLENKSAYQNLQTDLVL